MITVDEAIKLIIKNMPAPKFHNINLEDVKNTTLHEALTADRPLPPFNRVAMDGIAIDSASWVSGLRTFPIAECQQAGEPQKKLHDRNACIEVMTGAVLPEGCNCVIRYEDLSINKNQATISDDLVIEPMLNVHPKGADSQTGDLLVPAGTRMHSPQVAIAASVGKNKFKAPIYPKIAVVSTGDELIEIEHTPEPHQIRRSNIYGIYTALKQHGFDHVTTLHLPDNKNILYAELDKLLAAHDVIILSGGVSMGKFDYVPEILSDLKVREIFHKIRQKPGKPMWFGIGENNQLVFGLPGNPVSALITLHRYVLTSLYQQAGFPLKKHQPYGRLTKDIKFNREMCLFAPVTIEYCRDASIHATPTKNNGSGDFVSLAKTDGFLELPAEKKVYRSGECYPLFLWGSK